MTSLCPTRGRSSIGTTSGSNLAHEPHRSVLNGTDGWSIDVPHEPSLKTSDDAYSLVTVMNRTFEKEEEYLNIMRTIRPLTEGVLIPLTPVKITGIQSHSLYKFLS
ncbi:hypothetical protein [Sulfuracidifex metallicus]|uniref:hypothetical protein n=1 Tax=Sulfuracidifex metallicus TaxID=47303 RepID=UPI002276FFD7|nr:hypothetical protein [Sulfuracidifex metallicus]MCY0849711.1 hypothetical protein [Sulfuracidifex metallicus]